MMEQPKRSTYIGDYLTDKEGQVWTTADTMEVLRVIQKIERLAQEILARPLVHGVNKL